MKVTISEWSAIAMWKWRVKDDDCGICRLAFDACCPDCKFPGDDCTIVWGECTHCFHVHCIFKWLQSQNYQDQACPMCRRQWKFKTH